MPRAAVLGGGRSGFFVARTVAPVTALDFHGARRLALRIVASQCIATLVTAAAAAALSGLRAGYSALLGGTIGVVASLYFAAWLFRGGEAAEPQQILRGIYVGEFVKIAATVAMFVAVFAWMDVAPLALFVGYAATFLMYWVALLQTGTGAPGAAHAGVAERGRAEESQGEHEH